MYGSSGDACVVGQNKLIKYGFAAQARFLLFHKNVNKSMQYCETLFIDSNL